MKKACAMAQAFEYLVGRHRRTVDLRKWPTAWKLSLVSFAPGQHNAQSGLLPDLKQPKPLVGGDKLSKRRLL